jgi:multidrug efflux pump subunit AcrA (membrane-fusion protein)
MNDTQKIIQKKKPFFKRAWFYIVIVITLLLSGTAYSQYAKQHKPVEYETITATRGTLTQTVDATGYVESANELDLHFEMSGKIHKVHVQTNTEVEKNQLIAELESNDLSALVSRASAHVAKAQADLQKQLAGNTSAYIASMQAKVAKAQADLSQIKISGQKSIDDATSDIETAQNNLKYSEGGEDSQIVKDAYQDLEALLYTVQDSLRSALTESDNILGIDNTLANDEFETYLGIKDNASLSIAKTKYAQAKSAKNDVDTWMETLYTNNSYKNIDWAADTAIESIMQVKNLLIAVSTMLDATQPVGDLSISELTTLKTNIQTQRTTISTQFANLTNNIQNIDTAKNSYTTYQIAFSKATNDLKNTEDKSKADIAAYIALLHQAEANLDDAKNPPREVDVATYRALVRSAQADLYQAISNKNKAKILAPVKGLIGKVNVKDGEFISTADTIAQLVSPHFEIKVDIPETDIIKISLDDKASIKLDAFGDEEELEALVTEIEKGETIIQDVVYYSVTLTLSDTKNLEILNGMTADAIFYTASKENTLFIPQRIIRTNGIGKYVRILKGQQEIIETPITLGLKGDNGLIEITSGITEEDLLIVKEIK